MKKFVVLLFLVLCFARVEAQDTFSIVAIDSLTGEIGSAGASCVGSTATYPHGAAILSDVIPGTGVIHTQAAWNPINQWYAHDLMIKGSSPQEIIDSLVANDASNNPTTRQYGIADLNGGHPRSAAYTGVNCMNYKNHITGPGYSIQGNILLGQEILDSMQSRYLSTPGSLADRLMAALQGAKVLGADTRCAPKGTSSQSSFLRVGKPDDPYDTLYCDLWMAYPQNYPGMYPVDPIDSLQTLYDLWKLSVGTGKERQSRQDKVKVYMDSAGELVVDLSGCRAIADPSVRILDMSGRVLLSNPLKSRITRLALQQPLRSGVYLYQVCGSGGNIIQSGKVVF
jgi:uncharacterized Ntn-hydrolase superfamily protein